MARVKAVRKTEYRLIMSEFEAKVLSRLLYAHVGGSCPERDALSDIHQALEDAGVPDYFMHVVREADTVILMKRGSA